MSAGETPQILLAEIDGVAVGEELGRGGYASVWAGVMSGAPVPAANDATGDAAGDAPGNVAGDAAIAVAIKVAHRGTEVARRRVAREAAALARLDGRHAPRLVATGEAGGRPYLILERLGATLAVRGGGAAAVVHVARAVAAVHAAGVVHGDLKPDNLVVDGERAWLLDFGSARVDGAAAPVGAGVAYMAPELWRGGGASAASDVYALGAIACELATGAPPFTGDARAVGHAHLMLRPALDGLAEPLATLVRRCLAKDPAHRPAAAELAAALAEQLA
ncbi:MAG: protein kinase, partial [Deltaproteobacteria bacterium]|nr:protein kinase [Deltaproteobacteria bacterium]